MEITQGNLIGLFSNFQTIFGNAYQAKKIWHERVATTMPSGTTQEVYAWMQEIPAMREWIGPRQIASLANYIYTLPNKLFELTFSIDRLIVEDDKYGMYTPALKLMAERAAKWPDYQIAAAMQAGKNSLSYDGANFFSASHPVNKFNTSVLAPDGTTVQSNLFTNRTLNPDNLMYVMQSMESLVDEGGKPFGSVDEKWLLAVPPQLRYVAMNILNGAFIAPSTVGGATQVGSNDNVLKGITDLIVLPELANEPKAWYLMNVDRAVKPFIWQLRRAPALTPRISPTDPNVFDAHEFLFGEDGRGAPGYSLWWLAARAEGA